MDNLVRAVEADLVEHYKTLHANQQYIRTPNVENVVYITTTQKDVFVRGTRQARGEWVYEYVPGIGY